MFVTQSLNSIPEIIENDFFSEALQKKLAQHYVNLEATLLRAKVLRELSKSKVQYIVQSAIYEQQYSLAYLFSPFVLANLNQKVIYHSPATTAVLNILNRYYQAEKSQNFKADAALEALNLYLDLSYLELNTVDFFYYSLLKALSRTDVSSIYLITDLKLNQQKIKELEQFLKIQIHIIQTDPYDRIADCTELNMHKLLFKRKDETYIEICEKFSKLNAQLLCANGSYSLEQASRLIEDMFYAEHIYEKLSVYAEYIQTCLQKDASNLKIMA
jgi:hypothetical protein